MESLAPFKLFTEKAERLMNSNFVKSYKDSSGVDFSWEQGKAAVINLRGPNQEQTDAFVLTFRFFIQNNDSISFLNMAKAFEQEFVPSELRNNFQDAKDHLNKYLDSNSMFKIGEHITRRELLDVFVYGELSHANKEKRERYSDWMSKPIMSSLMKNEFASILFQVLNVISFVAGICDQVIHRCTSE